MGLLINQGVHDTSKDIFSPIVEDNVTLVISEIKLAKGLANTLEVTFRILTGANKNKFVTDRVTYDANSDFSWKYRQLRKCAGVPYTSTESPTIDIEKLLLNRIVTADLKSRKGKNKDGEEQEYQAINYKMSKVTVGDEDFTDDTTDFEEKEEISTHEAPAVETPVKTAPVVESELPQTPSNAPAVTPVTEEAEDEEILDEDWD